MEQAHGAVNLRMQPIRARGQSGCETHDLPRAVHLPRVEQAIVQSCNVYFYTLAVDKGLSLERMETFARRLGLGERTGLGINSEARGRIPTEAFEAREGTYQRGVRLNSAIGQGNVTATVLQVAVLYSALANGGKVMTPYLVDQIRTAEDKQVFQSAPKQRPDLEPLRRGTVDVRWSTSQPGARRDAGALLCVALCQKPQR